MKEGWEAGEWSRREGGKWGIEKRVCDREGKRREYRGNNNERVKREYEGRDGRE